MVHHAVTCLYPPHMSVCLLPPQGLGLIKYWKGTHLIHADPKIVLEHYAKTAAQKMLEVDPTCLHWQPLPTSTQRKRP